MGLHIGIDFGSSNTIIAYFNSDDELTFEYIPSLVFGSLVGESARDDSDGQHYENFKMYLPITNQEELKSVWNRKRSPEEVTKIFFETVLQEFKKKHGSVASIACTVHEEWIQNKTNAGSKKLKDIFEGDFKLSLQHTFSEPVSAAAYFAYRKKKSGRPFKGNLLLCDIGGATFDASLCKISETRIEALKSQSDMSGSGKSFDIHVIEKVLKDRGEEVSDPVCQELARAFEKEKIKSDNHETLSQFLDYFKDEDPEEHLDNGLYEFTYDSKSYEITYRQLFQAFQPIEQAIKMTVSRLKEWTKNNGESIDNIAILGGFGQYPLVQKAILESLDDEGSFHSSFNDEHMIHSVAAGAAVIASGKYSIVGKYPHSIGVKGLTAKEKMEEDYTIIRAGAEFGNICWLLKRNGNRLLARVYHEGTPLPIWIKNNGKENDRYKPSLPIYTPSPGFYYIGILIDSSYVGSLIFEHTETKVRTSIDIGNLSISSLSEV